MRQDGPDGGPAKVVTSEPLAHFALDGRVHLLVEHLTEVGRLASTFAGVFGASAWGELAGRWHDLGKYSNDFQNLIRTENGVEAHVEHGEGGPRDHSTAGALHALSLSQQALPLAFVIAGHHAGLADCSDLLNRRLKDPKRTVLYDSVKRIAPEAVRKGLLPPQVTFHGPPADQWRSLELWTRLLFSALCDADFLDTERFYKPDQADLRGSAHSLSDLRAALDAHLARKEARAPTTEVNRVRAEVRAACLAAAEAPPGVFSLTVPTGGGKTLAGLSFALHHAVRRGLDRVIVALPYTSIIEQTVGAYREALGQSDAVLEHHSSLDPEKETARTRIAAENWDAPVVVTTTVQLFESLLANRPGPCRKLHRLAKSVLILDEAQALSLSVLAPAVDVLKVLVEQHGLTLVISTATQPAWRKSKHLPQGFAGIHEIVPPEVRAFDRLRRVKVRWPSQDAPTTFDVLGRELAHEEDVLAIVHLRKDARQLCEVIDRIRGDRSTAHLSALMCAEHRSRVLASVRDRKKAGEPVRLVATQLVEAGVDLDFRVVYRALGGLDGLAQAAGRCNREGLHASGELRVFVAPTQPPQGVLRTGLGVARSLLTATPDLDLFIPDTHERYFSTLLAFQDLDKEDVQDARAELNFKTVARNFKIIDDKWSMPVVVPWGDAPQRVEHLRAQGASREGFRRLQRFLVQVPRKLVEGWIASGAVEVVEGVNVLKAAHKGAYDDRFGLIPERVGGTLATFLIE
jgi:CRISPR-associated endonuclease/helicase Cas3